MAKLATKLSGNAGEGWFADQSWRGFHLWQAPGACRETRVYDQHEGPHESSALAEELRLLLLEEFGH
jgi:hypothetical protein